MRHTRYEEVASLALQPLADEELGDVVGGLLLPAIQRLPVVASAAAGGIFVATGDVNGDGRGD